MQLKSIHPWCFLASWQHQSSQSTILIQTEISQHHSRTGVKCCAEINGVQRMTFDDLGDPLTFPLVPTQGGHLWFEVKCLYNYLMDNHYLFTDINITL